MKARFGSWWRGGPLVLATALVAVGCGDDSGGGGGGGGGDASSTTSPSTGSQGTPDFYIDDVALELREVLDGSADVAVALRVNVACPSGDCGAAQITVAGVRVGTPAELGTLAPALVDQIAAAAHAGEDVEVKAELDGRTATLIVTCPGEFDVLTPADGSVMPIGGDLPVTWSPFSGAYSDLVTSCYAAAYLFDKEQPDGSPSSGVLFTLSDTLTYLAADATGVSLPMPATLTENSSFSHIAVGVSEVGPIVDDGRGGTSQCTVRRYAVGPKGD